jgi:hypothetical protein
LRSCAIAAFIEEAGLAPMELYSLVHERLELARFFPPFLKEKSGISPIY